MESLLFAMFGGYLAPLFVGEESGDPDDQGNPLLTLILYVIGAMVLAWVLFIGGAWVLARANIGERIIKPIFDGVIGIIGGVVDYLRTAVELIVRVLTFGAV